MIYLNMVCTYLGEMCINKQNIVYSVENYVDMLI